MMMMIFDYPCVFSFYGTRSLKVALSHHLCARIQSCRGDFRSALNSEREAYQIYKLQVIFRRDIP